LERGEDRRAVRRRKNILRLEISGKFLAWDDRTAGIEDKKLLAKIERLEIILYRFHGSGIHGVFAVKPG
jgi:hypothetical protein